MESYMCALHCKSIRPLILRSRYFSHCLEYYQKRDFRTVNVISKATNEKNDGAPKFDYLALKCCTLDLQESLVPSKVEDIIQYHNQSLAIRLRNVSDVKWLTICWNPTLAHIGVIGTEPRRGAAAEVYSLGEGIRRVLRGLILIDASIPKKWERVVKLSFGERLEQPPKFYLYAEIMNRHSNVIVCNHDNEILIAANQIGSKKSSQRHIQVKRNYQLPPRLTGLPPDTFCSLEELKECLLSYAHLQQVYTIDQCISRSFRGIGPIQAQEIIRNADISSHVSVNSLKDSDWAALHSSWVEWLAGMEGKRFFYVCSQDGNTIISVFNRNETTTNDLRPLEFFGVHFNTCLEADESIQLWNGLKQVIHKKKDKIEKKITSLKKQMDTSDHHLSIKLKGDLVMSNLHLLQAGASTMEVDNWETGEKETIKLDPNKSGIENAENFYKKARKARRGAEKILPLIEESESDLSYLEENEVLLEGIDCKTTEGAEVLLQIESEFVSLGFIERKGIHKIKERASKKVKKKGKSGGTEFRRLTSPNGFEVLVGRSSQENDKITMKIAKHGDVWMHARGYPGAHVLIKCSQSVDGVENDDLQFAANIAAFYSKGSKLAKVDVIVADKKDIFKPKGAKPGQVLVQKERVIIAEPQHAVV